MGETTTFDNLSTENLTMTTPLKTTTTTTLPTTLIDNSTYSTFSTSSVETINSTFEPIILTDIPTEISTTPYSKMVTETIEPEEGDDSKFPVFLIVIIAISGLFLIIFLLIFMYYCIKKKLDFKETGLFNSSLTRIGRKSRLNKIQHGINFG